MCVFMLQCEYYTWFVIGIPVSHVEVDVWFEQPHVVHSHLNEFTSSIHVPPFWHGELAQSSISGIEKRSVLCSTYTLPGVFWNGYFEEW